MSATKPTLIFWSDTISLINTVNEAIEPLRREKLIRGSLEATVQIQPRNDDRREFLGKWGDELSFILIVSSSAFALRFNEQRPSSSSGWPAYQNRSYAVAPSPNGRSGWPEPNQVKQQTYPTRRFFLFRR